MGARWSARRPLQVTAEVMIKTLRHALASFGIAGLLAGCAVNVKGRFQEDVMMASSYLAVCKQTAEIDNHSFAQGELVKWDPMSVKRGGKDMVYIDRDEVGTIMDVDQFAEYFVPVDQHIRVFLAESFLNLARKFKAGDAAIAQWLSEYDEGVVASTGVRTNRPEMT